MQAAVQKLLQSLSWGQTVAPQALGEVNKSGISNLARIYEMARNALEYRADHLMRRAAIERILRRENVFQNDAGELLTVLGQELVWARYVGEQEWIRAHKSGLLLTVAGYLKWISKSKAPRDWLFGVMSAEIEQTLNPNQDYRQFNIFAFNALKNRVVVRNTVDADLILYAAVELVYGQTDEVGLAFRLFELVREQGGLEVRDQPDGGLGVAYEYFRKINQNRLLNSASAAMRKQGGPLYLIRDIYFADPQSFSKNISDHAMFESTGRKVLAYQLGLVKGRISRATGRSILYVFLTKVILGVGVEVPAERLFQGGINPVALVINLLTPVVVMWILARQIKFPSEKEQQKLLDRAWQIMTDFDASPTDHEVMYVGAGKLKWQEAIFYGLYVMLFGLIFAALYAGLTVIGFSVVSILVFVFFLSVVAFFAYRIQLSAQIYSYNLRAGRRAGLGDMLMLPLVMVGGKVSQGISRLNFLAFVFDFLLEAPFKTILRFLDSWTNFLSVKRDEIVG